MGMGMASVNQTRPHCVNQMGKTHSKPFSVTAWARLAMCESALRHTDGSVDRRLAARWVSRRVSEVLKGQGNVERHREKGGVLERGRWTDTAGKWIWRGVIKTH